MKSLESILVALRGLSRTLMKRRSRMGNGVWGNPWEADWMREVLAWLD